VHSERSVLAVLKTSRVAYVVPSLSCKHRATKACTIIKQNGHASFITSDLEEGLWPVAYLVRWEVPVINRWVDVPRDRDVSGKGIRPCRESNRDYRIPSQSVLWILLSVPQGQVLQICGRLVF